MLLDRQNKTIEVTGCARCMRVSEKLYFKSLILIDSCRSSDHTGINKSTWHFLA